MSTRGPLFAESHYTACLVARLRPARFGCHFAHQDGGESFELRVGVCFFALFYGASDPVFSARSATGQATLHAGEALQVLLFLLRCFGTSRVQAFLSRGLGVPPRGAQGLGSC